MTSRIRAHFCADPCTNAITRKRSAKNIDLLIAAVNLPILANLRHACRTRIVCMTRNRVPSIRKFKSRYFRVCMMYQLRSRPTVEVCERTWSSEIDLWYKEFANFENDESKSKSFKKIQPSVERTPQMTYPKRSRGLVCCFPFGISRWSDSECGFFNSLKSEDRKMY